MTHRIGEALDLADRIIFLIRQIAGSKLAKI
jgi:hypothetical protein